MKQITLLYPTADTELEMELFTPDEEMYPAPHPVLIHFYGNGWTRGMRYQHLDLARAYAQAGFVVALPDYRIACRQHTTPFESVEDAVNAAAFVRSQAEAWHIDLNHVVLGGVSSGGQMALMAGLRGGQPFAYALVNPAVNDDILERMCRKDQPWRDISPLYHLTAGTAPMILFHGEADHVVPISASEQLLEKARILGIRAELIRFAGADHSEFVSPGSMQNAIRFHRMISEALRFLSEIQ